MNAYRPSQIGRLKFLAFLIVVASELVGSVNAQGPKPANTVAKETADDSAFSDYRNWKRINAEPKPMPHPYFTLCMPPDSVDPNGPHAGGFVNIYVNKIGRDEYLSDKAPKFSPGAVIVKEKLTEKDGKRPNEPGVMNRPHELAVMIKREPGFAPDTGDWQYAFVDSKGSGAATQTKLNCARCHEIQVKNDYVFRRPSADEPSGKEGNRTFNNREN